MSQQQDQQHMHGERRQAQTQFQGPERRQPMQFGETAAPADPTRGDPGQEARLQEKIEQQRTSERDLSARVRPSAEDT